MLYIVDAVSTEDDKEEVKKELESFIKVKLTKMQPRLFLWLNMGQTFV